MKPLMVGLAPATVGGGPLESGDSVDRIVSYSSLSRKELAESFDRVNLVDQVMDDRTRLLERDAVEAARRIIRERDNRRVLLLGKAVTKAFEKNLGVTLPRWEWTYWEERWWLSLPHPSSRDRLLNEKDACQRLGSMILSEVLRYRMQTRECT